MARTQHSLAARNGEATIAQIIFECRGNGKADVTGIEGAAFYIRKTNIPVEEARAIYREKLNAGWAKPKPENTLTLSALQGLIYG